MARTLRTRCVVVGGGPAGMTAATLFARAGVDVVVLEKHKDFLRDFRGDTIHPSTLRVLDELGLLERFDALPHRDVRALTARVGGEVFTVADFTGLPKPYDRIAFIPQWDFLSFLARESGANPHFDLRKSTAATGLIQRDGRVAGVRAAGPDGDLDVEADLVIACDGRHSTLRDAAHLAPIDVGAPMDVLWFSLPRRESDEMATGGVFDAGAIFVAIDRGDTWQCGYVIAKGGDAEIRAAGLDAFRERVARSAPALADRVASLASLDEVKLLTVGVDRLAVWSRPGLLFIGDAAHTMSPVGGVGINLAIQDAVAAANILVPSFRAGAPGEHDLAAVQARREFPTKATQAAQTLIQRNVIAPLLGRHDGGRAHAPLLLRAVASSRWLRRIPARAIGMGVRPEKVSEAILGHPPA